MKKKTCLLVSSIFATIILMFVCCPPSFSNTKIAIVLEVAKAPEMKKTPDQKSHDISPLPVIKMQWKRITLIPITEDCDLDQLLTVLITRKEPDAFPIIKQENFIFFASSLYQAPRVSLNAWTINLSHTHTFTVNCIIRLTKKILDTPPSDTKIIHNARTNPEHIIPALTIPALTIPASGGAPWEIKIENEVDPLTYKIKLTAAPCEESATKTAWVITRHVPTRKITTKVEDMQLSSSESTSSKKTIPVSHSRQNAVDYSFNLKRSKHLIKSSHHEPQPDIPQKKNPLS